MKENRFILFFIVKSEFKMVETFINETIQIDDTFFFQ